MRRPAGDPTRAELTHQDRVPVDPARLRHQHAALVGTLGRLGLRIVWAAPLPGHPDAVFVEDAAVVVGDRAVPTRPGAVSRRDEVASVRGALAGYGLDVAELPGTDTLDGGDVLQVGGDVLVGSSTRTGDAGRRALAELLAPLGRQVVPVEVTGALHLKTALTLLPDGALIAVPELVELPTGLGREVVAADEPTGANVLCVDGTAVVSASAPRTIATLERRGLDVVPVAIDELEKLEAGVTCCCVLLPAARG